MSEMPTGFEIMTAIAFLYFVQEQCDIVSLEVGLGGRMDSTNVIPAPEVCVVANIGLEHTAILGRHGREDRRGEVRHHQAWLARRALRPE